MHLGKTCSNSPSPCNGCNNVDLFSSRPSVPPVVIKLGGELCADQNALLRLAEDLKEFHNRGVPTVVVHGGGPEIDETLSKFNIEFSFHKGKRVTSAAALEVVQMVLCGGVNRRIVNELNRNGVRAAGISGVDGQTVRCVIDTPRLGFVGRPVLLNPDILSWFFSAGITPVLAPIASGKSGQPYNINGDTFAGFLAEELSAASLLFLTNVEGVIGFDGRLESQLSDTQISALKDSGVIRGGMIPKVETALRANEVGVQNSVIVDGRNANACLRAAEGFSGVGTRIFAS